MEISNKDRTDKIKRYFNIWIIFLILITLAFVIAKVDVGAIISGVALFLTIIGVQFFQVNYIYYNSEGDKILIHFYPITSFFGKDYRSIEFKKDLLYFSKVNRISIFSDLYIAINTAKGIAEYPEISLMGLTKDEITNIEEDLAQYIRQGR